MGPGDEIAALHLRQQRHAPLEIGDRLAVTAAQFDEHIGRQLQSALFGVEFGTVGADDAVFLEPANAPTGRRRRQVDPFGDGLDAGAAILGKDGDNFLVGSIQDFRGFPLKINAFMAILAGILHVVERIVVETDRSPSR